MPRRNGTPAFYSSYFILFHGNINLRQQLFGSRFARVVQITFGTGFVAQRTFHFRQIFSVNSIIHCLQIVIRPFIKENGITSGRKRLESYVAFRRYLNRHYHAYICTQLLGRCHFGVVVIDAKRVEIPYWQVLFFDKLPQTSPGAAIIIQFVVACKADINHIPFRDISDLFF